MRCLPAFAAIVILASPSIEASTPPRQIVKTNAIPSKPPTGWNADANASGTGSRVDYETFMIQGLRTKVANYDCIWQLKLAVSDPRMSARLNSLQTLYYNLL